MSSTLKVADYLDIAPRLASLRPCALAAVRCIFSTISDHSSYRVSRQKTYSTGVGKTMITCSYRRRRCHNVLSLK